MPDANMIVAVVCVLAFVYNQRMAIVLALVLPSVVGTNLSGTYQELLAVMMLSAAVMFLNANQLED